MMQNKEHREFVERLRLLGSPASEAMPDGQRLTELVKMAAKAADLIEQYESYMTG